MTEPRVSVSCSAETALSYGFTGPVLRASGVPFDLRKDAPYYNYESFDFEVPVGSNGDIYDRFMIRFYEMAQSIRIIRQAMKNIPKGPINRQEFPGRPAAKKASL